MEPLEAWKNKDQNPQTSKYNFIKYHKTVFIDFWSYQVLQDGYNRSTINVNVLGPIMKDFSQNQNNKKN